MLDIYSQNRKSYTHENPYFLFLISYFLFLISYFLFLNLGISQNSESRGVSAPSTGHIGWIAHPYYTNPSGSIALDKPVGDVSVTASLNNQIECSSTSDWVYSGTGMNIHNYLCPNDISSTSNSTFSIECHQNLNILNGVTTFDVALIQAHIVGNQQITDPFRRIAADVNLSGTISSLDLFYIQNTIVGNYSSFPVAKSWEFINNYYFSVLSNTDWTNPFYADPFNMPESLLYPEYPEYLGPLNIAVNGSPNSVVFDWYGIKMGDVNVSYTNNPFLGDTETEYRSNSGKFDQSKNDYRKGTKLILSFSVDDFTNILAFQAGLKFDTNYIKVNNTNLGEIPNLPYDMSAFGTQKLSDGILNISWFHPEAKNTTEKEKKMIFSIEIEILEDLNDLSEKIGIDQSYIKNLYYKNDGTELFFSPSVEITQLNDIKQINKSNQTFVNPNPFTDEINFKISSNREESLNIEVLSTNGKLIKSLRAVVISGINNIIIDLPKSLPKGIYIYRVQGEDINEGGKIIKQ